MSTYRPTPCRCAGYTAPRILGRPGQQAAAARHPSDEAFHAAVDELEERIENKDNLHSTKLGYADEGEPVPEPEHADAPSPWDDDEQDLENTSVGYAAEGEPIPAPA